ncbi:kinase-like protein [Exidia glandulosa HHB12029]|uniref:Kinase-like protein n=1 Tax=Exidia glandulosa HHB12029 TaxID=1314781 RepID=A0A165I6P5_EXIGL|nr:kinase-like protein [Exidia glandulosa HHB12029]
MRVRSERVEQSTGSTTAWGSSAVKSNWSVAVEGNLRDSNSAQLSQATSGLQYLHAQNIIHGDLKGCNILVQDGIARLSDFGYSVLVAERLGSTSSHLGTLRWFAPEFMETGARRAREADIWALGCVVLEACTLEMPYHGRTDAAVPRALLAGGLPQYTYPQNMDMRLWRITEKCWLRYPSQRATLQDIGAHLQDILSPLRTVEDIFVLSTGSPFSGCTTASLMSAVARMCQEAGSEKLQLSRVRDVIGQNLNLVYPLRIFSKAHLVGLTN